MRTLQKIAFLLIAMGYYLGFLTFVVAQIGRFAGKDPTWIAVGGIGMVLSAIAILIWGFVAGTMSSRRGWNAWGKDRLEVSNWVSLMMIEGLFAFGTIAMAAVSYHRRGVFFPTPRQIEPGYNW